MEGHALARIAKCEIVLPVFRKDLVPLLLDQSLTVTQIARMVREAPRDVALDIQHLIRSLKHSEYQIVISPATCRKCAFEFGSDKLQKPSKCPECHSTWLTEPLIAIHAKPSPPS
jgi:predicted Zn-ribbon and HTH transcriptional regulator